MPSFKVDGNELVNIDIPDQFPGKVYREYNNTIQTGDGSNSENQKVSKKVQFSILKVQKLPCNKHSRSYSF